MNEIYIEQYAQDDDFKDVYATLIQGNHVEELNYHVHNNLLYHFGKLCVTQGERVNIIRESHTSLIVGHFGVGKIVSQLQRYCCWPCMNEMVSRYVKGCFMYVTGKTSNRKLGLYTPLLISSCHWEIISMYFAGELPTQRKVLIIFMLLWIISAKCVC